MEISAMEINEANTCMLEYTQKILDSLVSIDEKDEKDNVINTYRVAKDETATCQAFIFMKKEYPELYGDRLARLIGKYETVKAKDGNIVLKSLIEFYNENLELISLKNGTVLTENTNGEIEEKKDEEIVDSKENDFGSMGIPVVDINALDEAKEEVKDVETPIIVEPIEKANEEVEIEEKQVSEIPVVEISDAEEIKQEEPEIIKTPMKVKVVKRDKALKNKHIVVKAVKSVKGDSQINDVPSETVDKVESAPVSSVTDVPVVEEPFIDFSQSNVNNNADNYYDMIKDIIQKEQGGKDEPINNKIMTPEEINALKPEPVEDSKSFAEPVAQKVEDSNNQVLPPDVEEKFKQLDSYLNSFSVKDVNASKDNGVSNAANIEIPDMAKESIKDKIKSKVKVVRRNLYVWKDKASAIESKYVGSLTTKLKNKASEKYLDISHRIAVRKSKINSDAGELSIEDLSKINQMISDKDNNLSYEESVTLLNSVANLSNKVRRFAGKSR